MPSEAVLIAAVALAAAFGVLLWVFGRTVRALGRSVARSETLVQRLERSLAQGKELGREATQLGEERDSLVGRQTDLERQLEELDAAHEQLTLERNQLRFAYEALEAKLAQVEGAQTGLSEELGRLRERGDQNRQLYLLLRSLLDEHELLRAARAAMGTPTPRPDGPANRSVSRDGRGSASAPRAPSPVEQALAADDEEHRNAARVARVMVADLFLYNRNLLQGSPDENSLRSRLKVQFNAACETFESRVSRRVWEGRHYLKLEFDRVVRERIAEARNAGEALGSPVAALIADERGRPAPLDGPAADEQAARVARLMVADLLLSNLALVEEGIRDGRLAQALAAPYEAVRREYESRVAEAVLRKKHHLDHEFDRVLRELGVRHSLDSELDQLMADAFEKKSGDSPAA